MSNKEIEETIRNLNTGKAPDQDGTAAEHINPAKNELTPVITDIINTIFTELDVPDELKEGTLTPVHKKGELKTNPWNYRGIVVTNTIMKILESILKNRIDAIFDSQQNPCKEALLQIATQ